MTTGASQKYPKNGSIARTNAAVKFSFIRTMFFDVAATAPELIAMIEKILILKIERQLFY